MTDFERACIASAEDWVNSFEADNDFVYSEKFDKKMAVLCDKMRGGNYHKLTRKTLRFLIAAAIIFSIATTAFAMPASREYIIKKFVNHSSYSVKDAEITKIDKNIKPRYIPDGFELADNFYSDTLATWDYKKGKDAFLNIDITTINSKINFDTEEYDSETIEMDGVKYTYYKSDKENNGLIWNDGVYIYGVSGTVSKEIIIEVAQNIK